MTIEEIFKKYPYYIYPAIEALAGSEGEERHRLLRRIACGVGPTSALRTVIGIDPEEFRDFYDENRQNDLSTSDTIDIFLDKFGPDTKSQPDEVIAEVPIAPPAINYAETIADDEDTEDMPDDDTASMLNNFLGQNPPKQKVSKPENGTEADKSHKAEISEPLSETLVKIMIKKGNYRKAIEIITELNLKNPKKSIYFADQIRFLEKLAHLQESHHL